MRIVNVTRGIAISTRADEVDIIECRGTIAATPQGCFSIHQVNVGKPEHREISVCIIQIAARHTGAGHVCELGHGITIGKDCNVVDFK